MKVGDLVELSSYGKSLVQHRNYRGKLGLVIERSGAVTRTMNWWTIQWMGLGCYHREEHPRKDLKHAEART